MHRNIFFMLILCGAAVTAFSQEHTIELTLEQTIN